MDSPLKVLYMIANCYQLCVELDQWIRRRIRCIFRPIMNTNSDST